MATGRPRIERWANGGSSTLDGAINDSVTSLDVADASSFPAYPDFKIKINSEVLTVTAVSTNTFTVERAADDTTAASHSNGDPVTHVFTRDSVERAFQDNYGIDYSGGLPYNRVLAQGVTKTASDFTWTNQGSYTCSDADDGGLIMTVVYENLRQMRGKYLAAPSTPWQCSAFIQFGVGGLRRFSGGQGLTAGLFIRESDTGKFYSLNFRTDQIALERMNSNTSYNSQVDQYIANAECESWWLRIADDGTDIEGYVSQDGKNWELCWNESNTSFMTSAGPDQVGFFSDAGQSVTGTQVYFKSWILE